MGRIEVFHVLAGNLGPSPVLDILIKNQKVELTVDWKRFIRQAVA